jgi:hypothetical protein
LFFRGLREKGETMEILDIDQSRFPPFPRGTAFERDWEAQMLFPGDSPWQKSEKELLAGALLTVSLLQGKWVGVEEAEVFDILESAEFGSEDQPGMWQGDQALGRNSEDVVSAWRELIEEGDVEIAERDGTRYAVPTPRLVNTAAKARRIMVLFRRL